MPDEPIATPAGDTPPPAAPPADTVPKAEFEQLSRQVAELSGKVTEHEEAAQFYQQESERLAEELADAKAAPPPRGKPAAEPDAEPDFDEDTEKRLERTLAKRGVLTAAELEKRGLLTAQQARELVQEETQKLVALGELRTEYPELGNAKSDFFKAVKAELKSAGVKDPSPSAMRYAAQAVELRLRREGAWKDPDLEADRRARGAAAGAPGAGGPAEDTPDEEASDEQAHIAHSIIGILGTDKAGSIKAYKAQAKKPVNVAPHGSLAHQLGGR